MKKNFISICLLCTTIVFSGCNKKQDDVNISEWMFDDNLNIYNCEKILGKAEKEELNNCTQYFWNDYKICNKYNGMLSLIYSDEQDGWSSNPDRNSYSFHWTTQCSDDEYKHIFKDLKNFEYVQKYVSCAPNGTDEMKKNYEKENGECFNFLTTYKDENYGEKFLFNDYNTAYFVIRSQYKDGVLELQWGLGRVPIKE